MSRERLEAGLKFYLEKELSSQGANAFLVCLNNVSDANIEVLLEIFRTAYQDERSMTVPQIDTVARVMQMAGASEGLARYILGFVQTEGVNDRKLLKPFSILMRPQLKLVADIAAEVLEAYGLPYETYEAGDTYEPAAVGEIRYMIKPMALSSGDFSTTLVFRAVFRKGEEYFEEVKKAAGPKQKDTFFTDRSFQHKLRKKMHEVVQSKLEIENG